MAASGAKNAFKTLGKVNRALLPQLENIRDSRLGKPFFLIIVDYKNVLLELCSFIYKKPFRAVVNFSIAGAVAAIWMNNPKEGSYTEQLMDNANTLLLISDRVRNPRTTVYVENLMALHSEKRLQVYNLGFFSLVLEQDYNDTSCFYEARCYYFKQRWIYMYKRIQDIGFLRKWYYLDRAMVDYDVNEEELPKSRDAT